MKLGSLDCDALFNVHEWLINVARAELYLSLEDLGLWISTDEEVVHFRHTRDWQLDRSKWIECDLLEFTIRAGKR